MTTFVPKLTQKVMYTANGKLSISILGMGTITLCTQTNNQTHLLKLLDVIVALDIPVNVISIAKLCIDNLITVQFNDLGALFFRSEIITPSQTRGTLQTADYSVRSSQIAVSESNIADKTQSSAEQSRILYKNSDVRSINFANPIFYVPRLPDFLFSFSINKYCCDEISMSNIVNSLPSTHIPESMIV